MKALRGLLKVRPDLTVNLIYYEDQEELEDDVDIEVPLSIVVKEIRPLISLHWHGSESYYAGLDAELQRLLDLGPEGKALYNVWKAGENIDERLLHLADVTLSALATDLSLLVGIALTSTTVIAVAVVLVRR